MDFFGAFRAPGWPETDSPRKMIASSGVETEIRALGTRFVAIFRFRKICDVDYNLSSKVIIVRHDSKTSWGRGAEEHLPTASEKKKNEKVEHAETSGGRVRAHFS